MKRRRAAKGTTDPKLDETERLLEQPIPLELADLAKTHYVGANEGLVNGLLKAALRVVRGAVEDGAGLAVMLATPHTPQKKRDADPRVIEVMGVVNEALERGDENVSGRCQVTNILLGDNCEFFEGEWSHNGILSVVRAYLREASEDELFRMVVDARRALTKRAQYDREIAKQTTRAR